MPGTVALVQARMGSTRFPGKMIAPLGGMPVLEWVLTRVSQSKLLDGLILATTDLKRDDDLEVIAKRLGIDVYRGSEGDVLGRFHAAAKFYDVNFIVRVCADNPFIDPGEIDRLIQFYQNNPCDYACNHQARLGNEYVDGFGAEILSSRLLGELDRVAVDLKYREHATLYLWDHFDQFEIKVVLPPPGLDHSALRFDIDTIEDYEYIKSLVLKGVSIDMPAIQIVDLALFN